MGLFISASGIVTSLRRNDVTANNIANVDTAGFQASRAESVESPGGGARLVSATRYDAQAPLITTDNPLDLAPETGYFQVTLPDGSTAYTRAGRFGLNAQGEVVTAEGARLSPPISVPGNATSVTVQRDGTVNATLPGEAAPQVVGQIQVYQFANPNGLNSIGSGLYAETAASGVPRPAAQPAVLSGALTGSNVDLATEAVNTTLNSHAAKANIKAFRAQDDLLGELLNLTS